jgi:hypothetical protein
MKDEDKIEIVLFIIFFLFTTFISFSILEIDACIRFKSTAFGEGFLFLDFFIYLFPVFIFLIKRKVYAVVLALIILDVAFIYGGLLTFVLIEMEEIYTFLARVWEINFGIMCYAFYLGFKILINEHIKYRKLSLEEKRYLAKPISILKRLAYFFILLIYIIVSIIVIDKTKFSEIPFWLFDEKSLKTYLKSL